jgi:CRISPR/Cas system-associated exonuclease Cas4 (RecB family)
LPNRFDSIIKAYFNRYRPSGTLPPILQGKCQGRLEDPFVEDYTWRIKDGYVFVGKLDECLVTAKGRLVTVKTLHTPVDHKTTSIDPRSMEVLPAYRAQLDAYAFLLEKNGKKTTGYGHLIFYYPEDTDDLHEGCRLITDVKTLETDPKRTASAIKKAIEVIESPRPPPPSSECSFCGWYEKVAEEQSDRYSEVDAAGASEAGVQRRALSVKDVGRSSEGMIPRKTGAIVTLGKKANLTLSTAESQPQRRGATSWISQNPNTRYANGNLSWWAEQARKGHVIEWEMDKNRYTGRVRLDGHILPREAARKRLMQ